MGKAKAVDTKVMAEAVDRLGVIRTQIKALEAEEGKIAGMLKESVPAGTTVYGQRFTAEVVASTKRVVDAAMAFKKLGQKTFLKVCSVTITALKRELSDAEIDAISQVTEGSLSVRTSAIPQMQVPEGTAPVDTITI